MATFYVKNEQIKEKTVAIIGSDVNHIKNVLRFNLKDIIYVCDEKGIKYKARIEKYTNAGEILCNIEEIVEKNSETFYEITLFQGIPKGDKMELIIQKGTELGVSSFIPVQMARSIAKINDKNEKKKLERWNKIANEASKQCGRQRLPIVNKVINFENIIENISKYDIVLVPYENEQNVNIKQTLKNLKSNNIASIAIVIGPEGGFSDEEIGLLEGNGASICTLGPRILRTETAGIATVSMINYEYEL